MVRTLADFLEFCYIMRRPVLDEQDLAQAKTALKQFEKHRLIFQHSGVRPNGFSLPRMHAAQHYIQHTREFGAPNGLCSSMTEAKHIKAIKEPWRRSNRHNALRQILITNQRLDKLSASRVDFLSRGMLRGSCLSYTAQLSLTVGDQDEHDRTSHDLPHTDPFTDVNDQGPSDGPRALSSVSLAQCHGT